MLSLLSSGAVTVTVTTTATAAAVRKVRSCCNRSCNRWGNWRIQWRATRRRRDIGLGGIAPFFRRSRLLLLQRPVTVAISVGVITLKESAYVVRRVRPWQVNANSCALMIQIGLLLVHAIIGRNSNRNRRRIVGMGVRWDGVVVVECPDFTSRCYTSNSDAVLIVRVVFFLICNDRSFVAQDVGCICTCIAFTTNTWNRMFFMIFEFMDIDVIIKVLRDV